MGRQSAQKKHRRIEASKKSRRGGRKKARQRGKSEEAEDSRRGSGGRPGSQRGRSAIRDAIRSTDKKKTAGSEKRGGDENENMMRRGRGKQGGRGHKTKKDERGQQRGSANSAKNKQTGPGQRLCGKRKGKTSRGTAGWLSVQRDNERLLVQLAETSPWRQFSKEKKWCTIMRSRQACRHGKTPVPSRHWSEVLLKSWHDKESIRPASRGKHNVKVCIF